MARLMSAKEVADELGYGTSTIYEMVKRGVLRPAKGLRTYRFTEDEVFRLIGAKPTSRETELADRVERLEKALDAVTAERDDLLARIIRMKELIGGVEVRGHVIAGQAAKVPRGFR